MSSYLIAAAAAARFYRLGREWTREGVLADAAEFTEAEWQRLWDEPNLRIAPAEEVPEIGPDEAAIRAAIRELPPEAFAADGKPKVPEIRDAAPEGVTVTAGERDRIWQAMLDEGLLGNEGGAVEGARANRRRGGGDVGREGGDQAVAEVARETAPALSRSH